MKLYLIGLLHALDSHAAECGFAWLRRLVEQRVQTWKAHFDDAASSWVVKNMDEDPTERVTARFETREPTEQPTKAQAIGPKRHKCGGDWRAFMRSQHSNDSNEVSRRYLEGMTDRIRAEGQEAKQRGLEGHIGNCFGLRARDYKRKLLREKIQELCDAAQAVPSPHVAVQNFITEALTLGMNINDAASGARLQKTIVQRQHDRKNNDLVSSVKRFVADHTDEYVQDLVSAAPEFEGVKESLQAFPAVGAKILEAIPRMTLHQAADIQAWMTKGTARYTHLSSVVDKYWKHRGRQLPAKEKPCDDSSDEESLCWKLQYCVCTEEVKEVFKVRNSLLRCIKAAFPFNLTWTKDKLVECLIVLKFLPQVRCNEGEHPFELALCWALDLQATWYHFSHQALSPFESMFQECFLGDEEAISMANKIINQIVLKSSVEWIPIWTPGRPCIATWTTSLRFIKYKRIDVQLVSSFLPS